MNSSSQYSHHLITPENPPFLIIFFLTYSLLIGALLREVHKITKIPFNPMLLLSGIILGV